MTSALLALGVVLMLSVSGEVPQSRVRRVIGGKRVKEGEWPWLVRIHFKAATGYFWGIPIKHHHSYCTASLLNEWWILTAAHCIPISKVGRAKALTGKYYRLKMGDVSLKSSIFNSVKGFWGKILRKKKWRNWEIRGSKVIMYPKYLDGVRHYWKHDIALIKLREPAPTGREVPSIRDVKLPQPGNSEFPADNAQCVSKGWGCNKVRGRLSEHAMAVIMPKLNDGVCKRVYGVKNMGMRLCAGHFDKGKGLCMGDSGGPLVCKDNNGDWVHSGVLSFISGSRPGERPAFFARTSYYINWIHDTMKKN